MHYFGEKEYKIGKALREYIRQYIQNNPSSVLTKIPNHYTFETYSMFGHPYEAFWIEKGSINNFVEYIGNKFVKINHYPYYASGNVGIMTMAEHFFNIKETDVPNFWVYMYLYSYSSYIAEAVFNDYPKLHYKIKHLWVGDSKNYKKVTQELTALLGKTKIAPNDLTNAFSKIISWIESDIKQVLKSFELVKCTSEHNHPSRQVMFDSNNQPIYYINNVEPHKYCKIFVKR